MARDSDPRAGASENNGSLFSSVLAEENEFDRRLLWRLGSWGFAAVAAVAIAVMANQTQLGLRRDQLAAADLTRQAQQTQQLARESQNEARRLASAIDTLNSDRDRLYSRVTVLEQGLDSITGAIARQNTAPLPSAPAALTPPAPSKPQQASSDPTPPAPPTPQAAAPVVAPVASTPIAPSEKPRAEAAPPEAPPSPPPPVTAPAASIAPVAPPSPLVASKSLMSPPDPAASKLMQPEKSVHPDKTVKPKAEAPSQSETAKPAAQEPEAAEADLPSIPARRTEFAVDLGSAHSIGGLRALWRGLVKANPDLAALHPIIMVRESHSGLGMQLRLGAGPLLDAATAAKICVTLAESERGCETTVFDGQRLAMKTETKSEPKSEVKNEEAPQAGAGKSSAQQQEQRRKSSKRSKGEDPSPPKTETPSALSSFFGRKP